MKRMTGQAAVWGRTGGVFGVLASLAGLSAGFEGFHRVLDARTVAEAVVKPYERGLTLAASVLMAGCLVCLAIAFVLHNRKPDPQSLGTEN